MTTILQDPSFQLLPAPVGPWTYSRYATHVSTVPPSHLLPGCARLRYAYYIPPPPLQPAWIGGEVSQVGIIALQEGDRYYFRTRCNGPLTGYSSARVVLHWQDSEDTILDVQGPQPAEYTERIAGPLIAGVSPGFIQCRIVGTPGFTDELYFDDFMVAAEEDYLMSQRGHARIYSALMTTLQGINGDVGGYYHNIGGRVFPTLITPPEVPTIQMPYICVPACEAGGFDPCTQSMIATRMRVSIVGYLPLSDLQVVAGSGSERAWQLIDDILMAVLPVSNIPYPAWNLGSAGVEDVEPVMTRPYAGSNDGAPYDEAVVVLDVRARFSRSDLGPRAV